MELSTLAKRVITAGILIPIVVTAILFLETEQLAIGIAAIALLAGLEWTALVGINNATGKALFLTLLAASLYGTYGLISYAWFTDWIFVFAAVWWLGITITLFSYEQIDRAAQGVGVLQALICFVVLIPLWVALLVMHNSGEDGPLIVLFLLVLIWVADSGAYFSGLRWGKTKLAPVISPKKTWEGVYGALFGALICGDLLMWYQQSEAGALWLMLVCVVTVSMSIVGDLFESVLKRRMDMKDSGNLLPGHGGVLDRIDSLIAAAPVFTLGLQLTTGL
jgi:phosphatidate cytidylyltransferase